MNFPELFAMFSLLLLQLPLLVLATERLCFGENCPVQSQKLEQGEICEGLACNTKEELLQLISEMQKEKAAAARNGEDTTLFSAFSPRHMFMEADVTGQCSICNSTQLCLNGGTCVPDQKRPYSSYYCICPDNTSGRNCQNIISCKSNTCGSNADCFVQNRQLNCVCRPGYSGNPWYSCSIKFKQSCMSGDPHYTTFDNLHFDYQGTCPYVFSQPCKNMTAQYSYSVRAKNELINGYSSISQVSEVEVDFYGKTIHVDGRSKTVLVDGLQVFVPWSYPSALNFWMRVRYSGGTFYIENNQNVLVRFSYSSLCLQVPDIPQYNGMEALCGLAGNIDGLWSDDVRYRNGTVLPIAASRQPTNKNRAEFLHAEDDWITDRFLKLRDGVCVNGQTVDNTTNCDSEKAAALCYPILQAEAGQGPFAGCSLLSNETIENFYYNCIYDVCYSKDTKCTALGGFLSYCQAVVPYSPPSPTWRDTVGCPLACPLHSHHSICTSSCPSTCAEPYPEQCDKGCVDGCECDDGYIIDNTVTALVRCIKVENCGCTDDNGNAHAANQPWLTNNCTIYHECRNGTQYSDYRPCADTATCANQYLQDVCLCLPGYRGNGYNCTDINECVETPGICGHGQCVNTPGSYQCMCDDYWLGNNCQVYKPRRHCADLYVYWGIKVDGMYTINPPFVVNGRPPLADYSVYCLMASYGGGFTLLSSDDANLNTNKSYSDYVNGFGDPSTQRVWLGLELAHGLTNLHDHSLRLVLSRCANNGLPAKTTDCTYPLFRILDNSTQYAVVIPKICAGSEAGPNYYEDGWARWDLTKVGPRFSAFDSPVASARWQQQSIYKSCSEANFNTGWWYGDSQLCGAANLNGVRYSCNNIPINGERYLRWAEGTMGQSFMWLRPAKYPLYDTTTA